MALPRLPLLVGLAMAVLCRPGMCVAQGGLPAAAALPPSAPNVALVNGQWFDGRSFRPRTVYSVGGRFTSSRPVRVDTTLDLAGTWVVPPFGEAHNHNIDGAVESRARQALARYATDGVFYVQIQGNFPLGEELRRRLPMNRPDAPDVARPDVPDDVRRAPDPAPRNRPVAAGLLPGLRPRAAAGQPVHHARLGD